MLVLKTQFFPHILRTNNFFVSKKDKELLKWQSVVIELYNLTPIIEKQRKKG